MESAVSEVLDELAFTLAKIRYTRAVIREAGGRPEYGEKVLEALREAVE